MSYSICIACEKMVPAYEKYCSDCLRKFPQLRQQSDFWKTFTGGMDTAKLIARIETTGK